MSETNFTLGPGWTVYETSIELRFTCYNLPMDREISILVRRTPYTKCELRVYDNGQQTSEQRDAANTIYYLAQKLTCQRLDHFDALRMEAAL